VTLVQLTDGDWAAAVDMRGGGLHSLTWRGDHIVERASLGDRPGAWDGRVLAPWPNRLASGRYEFDGASYSVPVNEPARDNALHGLVWALDWDVVDTSPSAVQLRVALDPSPGYPWRLDLAAHYSVGRDGLTVRFAATNRSDRTAPFGCGFHPYLRAPGGSLNDCQLSFRAHDQLDVTPERLLPRGTSTVGGGPFDFATSRLVGTTVLDTAFAALARDDTGRARLTLRGPDGSPEVTCWWDASFPWLQLYTPGSEPRARIAVEPMTCPADAFNSGVDLIRLAPGGTWSGSLGIATT